MKYSLRHKILSAFFSHLRVTICSMEQLSLNWLWRPKPQTSLYMKQNDSRTAGLASKQQAEVSCVSDLLLSVEHPIAGRLVFINKKLDLQSLCKRWASSKMFCKRLVAKVLTIVIWVALSLDKMIHVKIWKFVSGDRWVVRNSATAPDLINHSTSLVDDCRWKQQRCESVKLC